MSSSEAHRPIAGTRILHVTESAIGGVDLVLGLMHKVAQEHGVEDHFILPHDSELHTSPRATTRYFQLHRGLRLLNLFPLLALTLTAAVRLRPRVIWLHSTFAGLLRVFLWPLRSMGVRVVYCPHGWGMDRPRGAKLIGIVENFLSWFGSGVHCISAHEMLLGQHIGIPPRKLLLLVNALPDPIEAPAPKYGIGPMRALFVGRLDHQKGADLLLTAFEKADRKSLSLTIIGDFIQDKNPELAGRIRRLQDQSRLIWRGWQSRDVILQTMAASDVVLVTSRWEGFGLVAIESLACGTPVIATAVGGLSEIVSPEVGWLVDSEAELQELLEVLSVDEAREKSQACLQRFRSKYSQTAYSQRYSETLRLILN